MPGSTSSSAVAMLDDGEKAAGFLSAPDAAAVQETQGLTLEPNTNLSPAITPTAIKPKSKFARRLKNRQHVQHSSIPVTTPQAKDNSAGAGRGIVLDPQQVLKAALPRIGFGPGDFAEYEYDGLSSYFVSEADERTLIMNEVTRLVEAVKNPNATLLFPSSKMLGKGSSQGYMTLARLSKKILKALRISQMDNDGISLLHANLGIDTGDFATDILRVQPDDTPNESDAGVSRDYVIDYENIISDTHLLLDYVTATLAKFITQVVCGPYWNNNMLGTIAKWTAKVKLLLRDLDGSSLTAVRNAQSALDTYRLSHGDNDKQQKKKDSGSRYTEFAMNMQGSGDIVVEQIQIRNHCVHQQKLRSGIMPALRHIFTSLLHLNLSDLPSTTYEVCAVVMETGFEGFKALLYQDRDYEFCSTSDLDNLNFAHPAFQILNSTVLSLRTHKATNSVRKPPPMQADDLRTIVEWTYADSDAEKSPDGGRPNKLELSSMDDIVTVMVPLALASPAISYQLKHFMDMFYLTSDVDDLVRPCAETPFDAFFRLYTNAFELSKRPTDVLRLSEAVQNGLLSRNSLMESQARSKSSISSGLDRTSSAQRSQKLKKYTQLMDKWVYDESAVVVKCRAYVSLVTLAAVALVGGGLAIGLTLHQRLKGVDPFDFTVYAWALSAFVVLVCKSIKVQDWSWRDFLHGQVRCRSVSELSAVTGVNEQLIMAKLLHDEQDSILKTRGPYNAVFHHRAAIDGAGFSIDQPLNTKTMLLSGLSMLKVETPLGHALVCLDARRGTDCSVVTHKSLGEKKDENLVCANIDRLQRPGAKNNSGRKPLRLPLKLSKELEWRKVEGIYNVLDAVFV